MKVIVKSLKGDATVLLYNKKGELIHTEGFTGSVSGENFIRNVPVDKIEYGYSKSLYSGNGKFIYEVV